MKALLNYNGFTRVIDIPEFRQEIRIPVLKPIRMSILPEELEPEDGCGYWRFVFKRRLMEDLTLYEFEEDSKTRGVKRQALTNLKTKRGIK